MGYVIFLLIMSCRFVDAMLPKFDSAHEIWETNYKTNVVKNYKDAELRSHFEDLRVDSGVSVPQHIHDALDVVVKNSVGKSVISNIIASLEPRVLYMRSLRAIVYYISTKKDDVTTAENALRVGFGLINTISPGGFVNKSDFITKMKAIGVNMESKLKNAPENIAQTNYSGGLFIALSVKNANALYNNLKIAVDLVENQVKKYLFSLVDGDDKYSRSTNTISVDSAKTPKSSVVTGPRLATYGKVIGVVSAKQEVFTVDERLIHEILHYDHITLREEYNLKYYSKIDLLAKAIIKAGFYPAYTGVLQSLWTNPEELRTITGLLIDDAGNLRYSKNSEYRYMSSKGKHVRCSHSGNYCTKVPWYFMDVIINKTGVNANYAPGEDRDVDYKKQNDDLV